ncbi:hypothetical protein FGO68_gene8535 [Halteria grandinella]|uniref:Uncharacterized protein n=1 Tax=Halteria grandinella TaxID=5974 RepID=A0A8J8NGQ1_HALGN|nr:hypothetical protein FGO68_gene8535 [Halteria grandinella]
MDVLLCLIFFILCTIVPSWFFWLIYKQFDNLGLLLFKSEFGVLIENVSTQSFAKASFNIIELLKLQLTIIALLLLRDYPSIQITLLYLQSVLFQTYIVHVRPFEDPLANIVQVLNEIFVTLYLLPMIVLTDYVDDYYLKYSSGIMLISVYILSFSANLLYFIGKSIAKIVANHVKKSKQHQLKVKKEEIYKQIQQKEVLEVVNKPNNNEAKIVKDNTNKKAMRKKRRERLYQNRLEERTNAQISLIETHTQNEEHLPITMPKLIQVKRIERPVTPFKSRFTKREQQAILAQIEKTFPEQYGNSGLLSQAIEPEQVSHRFGDNGRAAKLLEEQFKKRVVAPGETYSNEDKEINVFANISNSKERKAREQKGKWA